MPCNRRCCCTVLIPFGIGFGILLVIPALILPGELSRMIKNLVDEKATVNDKADFLDLYGTYNHAAYLTVFNCTNARAVQLGTEKPIWSPVSMEFKARTETYDAEMTNGGKEVEFRLWQQYWVHDKDKYMYEKAQVIVPNIQYIAGIYQQFGTESAFLTYVIPTLVSSVNLAYTAAVPALFQFSALSLYLTSMSSTLIGKGVLANEQQVIAQWAFTDQKGTKSLTQFLSTTDATLSAQVAGFEMDQPAFVIPSQKRLTTAEATKLWDKTQPYALTNPNAVASWLKLYSCMGPLFAKGAAAADFVVCINPGTEGAKVVTWLGTSFILGAEKLFNLANWLVALSGSAAYLKFFQTSIVPTVAEAQNAKSFSDIGLLQFGSSDISQAMFQKNTVRGMGVLPASLETAALELRAYDVNLPKLTIDQTKSFMTTWSKLTDVTVFIMAVAKAATGDTTDLVKVIPTYSSTGLSLATATPYSVYLSSHLVQKVFVASTVQGNGAMDAGGVFPSNTGMFCRLTPQQIMEGWTDPLVAAILPTPYKGFLASYQYKTKEEHKASKGPKRDYGITTGNGNKRGIMTKWRTMEKFHRRDSLPNGTCADSYTVNLRKDPTTCYVWENETVIRGVSDGLFMDPYPGVITYNNYKGATTGSSKANIWSDDLYRSVEMVRTGFVTQRDIRLERWSFSENVWLNDCTKGSSTGKCNKDNQKYYMNEGDGIWPLETYDSGLPIVASYPYFLLPNGTRTDLHKCINISESKWPTTFKEGEHGTYYYYEPLTGVISSSASYMQVNLRVNAATFDTLHKGVFTDPNCATAYFPVAVVGLVDPLSDKWRDVVIMLYRAVEAGYAVSVLCFVIWPLSLAAAIAFVPCMASCSSGAGPEGEA